MEKRKEWCKIQGCRAKATWTSKEDCLCYYHWRRKIAERRDEAIRIRLATKNSTYKIAKDLNCHHSTVSRYIRPQLHCRSRDLEKGLK
jgi:DNA invertase Pin-like site-specific DNA recombinase